MNPESFNKTPAVEVIEAADEIINILKLAQFAQEDIKYQTDVNGARIPISLNPDQVEVFGTMFSRKASNFEKVDVFYNTQAEAVDITLNKSALN